MSASACSHSPLCESDVGEVVGAAGLQVGVAGRELGRGGDVPAGGLEVSRGRLDPGGEQERGRPLARRGRLACGGERGEQALCAAGVAEDDPRPAEPVGDLEPSHGVAGRAPGQRGVDVGALGAREREVLGLLRAAHALRRRGGLLRIPRGVRVEAALREPRLGQGLERERADALEQPVAGRLVHDHQRAAREPAHDVDCRLRRHVERAEHRLRRRERRAAGEGGQRPEAALVVGEQQVVAPPDRRPQRSAALGLAARRVAQHGEAVVEPARDLLDGQRPRARRRELDRERQAVERPAQLAHLLRVARAGRPEGEELDSVFEPQRSELEHGLACELERHLAGAQDPQRRRRVEQALHERRGGVDDVLAVVEDQHRLRPAQALLQRRLASDDAERGDDRVEHVVRGLRGLEPDEPDGNLDQRASRRDRDSRLADAAWADDLDEAVTHQKVAQRRDLAVARHELGCKRRQVSRAHAERPVLDQDLAARSPSAAGPAPGRARPRGGCGRADRRPARRPAGPHGRGR